MLAMSCQLTSHKRSIQNRMTTLYKCAIELQICINENSGLKKEAGKNPFLPQAAVLNGDGGNRTHVRKSNPSERLQA
jgi:hypothetical protein